MDKSDWNKIENCKINKKDLLTGWWQVLLYLKNKKLSKLKNSGKKLDFEVALLYHNNDTGMQHEHLHIYNIPEEKYSNEALVIEIQW